MKTVKSAVVIALAAFALSVAVAFVNPLETVEWKVSDMFFRPRGASDVITIIAIDDKSIAAESGLGRFKDWPRNYYAKLIERVSSFKPALIAIDLDFSVKSQGISAEALPEIFDSPNLQEIIARYAGFGGAIHPDDKALQDAIDASAVKIALPSKLVFAAGASSADSAGLNEKFPAASAVVEPIFGGPNAAAGFINVFRDRDGVLRRFMPYITEPALTPGFPYEIAKAYFERESDEIASLPSAMASAPAAASVPARISYAAGPFSYKTISFADALKGAFRPEDIADKIVLVGATAPILQDLQVTPTSRLRMPGVEVNANIIQQILENKQLREQRGFSLIILLALITFGGAFLMLKLRLKTAAALFVIVFLLYPVAAFGMYQYGSALKVLYPELAWIFTAIAALWYRNKSELKEKRMIKNAFAHYLSPVVVNELARHPEHLRLGGSREQISVLFSDIVGFTTLSEKLTPEDTVALLNDYLSAMTEIVFEYHGTLDKYQGDAIMALFGAPLKDEHHAVNAGRAALNMRHALTALHEKWNSIQDLSFKDELITLDFRVGIASGPAVIGNVGSSKRFDYTAIGDIVNLGSRLESVNRKYGTHVIVDKGTFTVITENHNPFVFRALDKVRVKGKTQATEIFEIYGFTENVTSDARKMLDDFEAGRILYLERNFADAKQYFESALAKISGDGPSQIYRNRCNFFLRKPPPREWDGIVDIAEK